jgi:hypothetical protein
MHSPYLSQQPWELFSASLRVFLRPTASAYVCEIVLGIAA